ncbi:MAG: hypothetical protein Q8N56_02515, partial [bacterium]|nr:hypothetical protein [bacterium]
MKFKHTIMVAKIRPIKKIGEIIEAKLMPGLIKFIFIVIIGILLFSNLQMNQRRRQLMLKISELDQEIVALEKRNQEL